jgi:hypothetical protein
MTSRALIFVPAPQPCTHSTRRKLLVVVHIIVVGRPRDRRKHRTSPSLNVPSLPRFRQRSRTCRIGARCLNQHLGGLWDGKNPIAMESGAW